MTGLLNIHGILGSSDCHKFGMDGISMNKDLPAIPQKEILLIIGTRQKGPLIIRNPQQKPSTP